MTKEGTPSIRLNEHGLMMLRMLAKDIEASGLRIEDHIRWCQQGIVLSTEAAKIVADTVGPVYPGNETLQGIGLDRTGGFIHPLSAPVGTEGHVNSWAAISIHVSVANGWQVVDGETQSASRGLIHESVNAVAPNVSVDELLYESRYSDAALLKLIVLAVDGLQLIVEKAFKAQNS